MKDNIASAQNATYKKLLSLTNSKGLKKEGLFLLSGEKLVREYLEKPHLGLVHEIIAPKAKALQKDAKKYISFSAELFRELDVLGTHFNILVLERPPIPVLSAKDVAAHKPKGIEIVIPVGDPGNLGALTRSCEAFGVSRIILTQESAHPFLPKSVKASAGSVLRLPMARGPALTAFPDDAIALDMKGEDLYNFAWPKSGYLVVGEEGQGMPRHFTRRITVPTQTVESLNAVVAASIALSDWARKKG